MPFELFVPKNIRIKSYYPRIYAGGTALVVSKEYLLKSQIKEFKCGVVYMDIAEQKIGIHFTNKEEGIYYKCSETGSDKSDLALAIKKTFDHFGLEFESSLMFVPTFETITIGKEKKQLMIIDVEDLKKRIEKIKSGKANGTIVALDQKRCIPISGSRGEK